MNKNIFNKLDVYENNEEKIEKPKTTKKERREKDQFLREVHGDYAEKNESRQKKFNDKKGTRRDDKNRTRNYKRQEPNNNDKVEGGAERKEMPRRGKRDYERHSGTGRPAFKKNDFKKDGAGKGNVGNVVMDALDPGIGLVGRNPGIQVRMEIVITSVDCKCFFCCQ